MSFKIARGLALLASVAVLGCGSGGTTKCITGETKGCSCTNGQSGAQTCAADGTFGACVCSGGVGGGAGGGTGGAAGGGAGGGAAGGGSGGGAAGGGAGGGAAGGGAGGGAAGGGAGGGAAGGGAGGAGGLNCVLPTTIDWLTVGKNSSTGKSLTLSNPTAADITATVGSVYSTTGDHTAFVQSGALGVVTIAAGSSETATITFNPTASKVYTATVEIRVAASCPLQTITLTGTAVDAVLTWAPTPVDFSYAPLNFEVFRELTFTNLGAVPVQLTNLVASLEFRNASPASLTVPAAGTAKVNLGFKPVVVGPRGGQLQFSTDLPAQPTGIAQLKGAGGGPTVEVTPSPTLAFGQVAYFAGANPPSFSTRTLVVKNIGPAPAVPDPNANLKFGTPAFDVVALNAQTMLSEFAVTVSPTYVPATGIAAGTSTTVQVVFTPASIGTKSIEITLHTNDLQTPDKKITVTADAVVLPTCTFTASPAAVAFGLVGTPRDFPVTLTNTGTGACQFSNVSIQAGSNPAFQVAGGTIPQLNVPAGQSAQVVVRVAPTTVPPTLTAITGTLVFNVSSPTTPQATVALTATLGPTCLTVSPGTFDFGTVKTTCSSATVGFQVFNTCATPVTITSSSMTIGATEFLPVSIAGIAPNTVVSAGGAPAFFSIKYKPLDLGPDTGAFSLNVTQSGVAATYVLPLRGTGDAAGQNVDTTLVGTTKTDILLIVDDSGSMFDKQQKLALNFQSFVSAAGAVDWQMGVTTTDMMLVQGKLVAGGGALLDGGAPPAQLPKIMTPGTPNLANVFASKVNVGTNGDAVEQSLAPMVAALTPPLSASDNAGFLRPDSSLSIVSISDADDQSPQPVSFYVSQVLNLKPPGKVTYSAMAPLLPVNPPGCTYDMPGTRTPQAITAIGGVANEICEVDWAPQLAEISTSVFGGRNDVYYLRALPDLTGGKVITVKLDGVTVPTATAGGATIWSYDAVNNAVAFTPFFIPQPGQTVTLSYVAVCL